MVTYLGSLVQSCYGEGGPLLTSLARVGSARGISASLGLPRSRCVCFHGLHSSGSRWLYRELSEAGPGLVPFPGLSRSGSGSRGLRKGADSVGPAFCALPRSEQRRRPGARRAQRPLVGGASYRLPRPSGSGFWVAAGRPSRMCPVPLLGSGSLTAILPADVNHPESQEVLVSRGACL